ncbi:MAG: cell division protein FtsZ [Pseudomonadota bacterium]
MALNFTEPQEQELRARIAVFGVGGAGGNAVNNMIAKELPGVEFIAANTDSQALMHSKAERKLQLGAGLTKGLGAGSKPDVGYTAAEESLEEIVSHLDGSHMCFITAGMGGGTGTGAAPVVARAAREMGILTVGVVTKPFQFEGTRRMQIADLGCDEMQKVVDTLIVIPNQNLFQVASEKTTFVDAFIMADDVLYQGVQGVTDLMVRPGMINLDFADVRSVMEEMGKAMMGTGEAEGETRAIDAAEKAIANPLLDEVSLKGAKGVLINITGGYDLTLFEMDEAANRIKDEVDGDALIKFGSTIDPDLEGKMRVSVVATGIEAEVSVARPPSEMMPRRRPAAADAAMLDAVRPRTARSETSDEQSTPAMAEEDAKIEDLAAPEPAAPEVLETPDAAPADEVPLARSSAFEAAAASSPSPEDIRRRAEQVRERALRERERQRALEAEEEARAKAQEDEEPALFDLDSGSLDQSAPQASPHAPLRQPEPSPDPAPTARRELPVRPRREANPFLSREEQQKEAAAPEGQSSGRSGLFDINRLIHRVAGGAGSDTRFEPDTRRRDEDLDSPDEADGDIPAFLRRQAN